MQVSRFENRRGEARVGIAGTLGELAGALDALGADKRVSLTFSVAEAEAVAGRAEGALRAALRDAGLAGAGKPATRKAR